MASRVRGSRPDKSSRGYLKGCALGCAALALMPVLAVVVVGSRTFFPLRAAGRAQDRLEARFGPPEAFAPAADGAVPARRIETFLAVRHALSEPCKRMKSLRMTMAKFDHTVGQKQPSSGLEVAGGTWYLGEMISGLTPLVGDFFEYRNLALLDQGMGFGEYAYIYALAYGDRFTDGSLDDELFAEGGAVTAELQRALRRMLERQLDALTSVDASRIEMQRLEREISAMHEDPLRLPWRDGLPPTVASSLEPFRDRLDAAWCQATAGIEMDRDTRRALAIALE